MTKTPHRHSLYRYFMIVLIPLTALLLAGSPVGATPILQIDASGQLYGATGVDVGGTLYDVEFLNGTCIDLYNECDEVSDFTFQTEQDAKQAAQALLDQVLVNVAGGDFDDNPKLTKPCSADECSLFTPYKIDDFLVEWEVFSMAAINEDSGEEDVVRFRNIIWDQNTRGGMGAIGYAVWSLHTQQPIPGPTTLLLLSSGLLGLVGYRWRQGRREGQHIG